MFEISFICELFPYFPFLRKPQRQKFNFNSHTLTNGQSMLPFLGSYLIRKFFRFSYNQSELVFLQSVKDRHVTICLSKVLLVKVRTEEYNFLIYHQLKRTVGPNEKILLFTLARRLKLQLAYQRDFLRRQTTSSLKNILLNCSNRWHHNYETVTLMFIWQQHNAIFSC